MIFYKFIYTKSIKMINLVTGRLQIAPIDLNGLKMRYICGLVVAIDAIDVIDYQKIIKKFSVKYTQSLKICDSFF